MYIKEVKLCGVGDFMKNLDDLKFIATGDMEVNGVSINIYVNKGLEIYNKYKYELFEELEKEITSAMEFRCYYAEMSWYNVYYFLYNHNDLKDPKLSECASDKVFDVFIDDLSKDFKILRLRKNKVRIFLNSEVNLFFERIKYLLEYIIT